MIISAHALTRCSALLLVLGIGVVSAGTGCAAQADDDEAADEDIGTQSQAFSGIYGADWGVYSPSWLNIDGAATATHSCFLTGIFGNLDSHNDPVRVGMRTGSPNWLLDVRPDSGNPLRGQAACVKSIANRTPEVNFYSGQGAQKLGDGGPAFPARRCFLTNIRSRVPYGAEPNDFASSNDRLRVFQNSITKDWYIGGTGNASGTARCIDVTEDLGGVNYYGPGTYDVMEHVAGRRCFLTEVGGAFTANDFNNGVSVYVDNDSLRWKLKVSAGKFAAVQCAR